MEFIWGVPAILVDGSGGFLNILVPLFIIHFRLGASLENQPAIGVPPWKPHIYIFYYNIILHIYIYTYIHMGFLQGHDI